MKPLLPALALCLAAVTAPALDWKTRELSLQAVPLQHTLDAAFEFTNSGDQTVTITGVDTSCDCLEAKPSAREIGPGAHGTINAHFNIRGAFGVLQRLIVVRTDDGQPPVTLSVELTVPDVATLTPRFLEWKIASPAPEGVIDIKVAEGVSLTVERIAPTSAAFRHRLEVVEPGRHFRLYLAPVDTGKVANAAIRLYARAANGEEVVVSAYANVR